MTINKYIENGKLINFPSKLNKKRLVIKYISDEFFEENRDYTEKEINTVLKEVYEDFALIRRYLIDFKFFDRSKDGAVYRKIDNQ